MISGSQKAEMRTEEGEKEEEEERGDRRKRDRERKRGKGRGRKKRRRREKKRRRRRGRRESSRGNQEHTPVTHFLLASTNFSSCHKLHTVQSR